MGEKQTAVRRIFRSRGISQCGFCPYEAVLPLLPVHSQCRIPSGAKTVIFALFPYYIGEYPHRNISRYAVPDDYHLLAGNLLVYGLGGLAAPFLAVKLIDMLLVGFGIVA